jgi:hypothetical protein
MPHLYPTARLTIRGVCTGNCSLSEGVANELNAQFAQAHFVTYEEPCQSSGGAPIKYFASVPIGARGIPHNFTVGMHSAMQPHAEFLETARELTGRTERPTVDSVMVLPFSAWTQALRPDVEEKFDASLRGCFREELEVTVATGRAHLPDATAEAAAIVTEPLFRRPQQVSSGDCPFATAYEAVDTFFNAANTLALLARTCAHADNPNATDAQCIAHLHSVVDHFALTSAKHGSRRPHAGPRACDAAWAADALVLLNVMYPTTLTVGDDALLQGIAMAAPYVHNQLRGGHGVAGLYLSDVATTTMEERNAVRKFWRAFRRDDPSRCAWKWGVAPLLEVLLANNGSHNPSPHVRRRVKEALESAARAVWLVHSPDGVERPPEGNPASEVASPMHLARHQIDPVFAGNGELGIAQRGALIGIKPHSYRQVLAELCGAHIPDVDCNVTLNEGGLGLRVSSDPMILDKDGEERTDKSVSPIQTEGDEVAYGKRSDKKTGSIKQKQGWDRNAQRMAPLFTAVEPPRPAAVRARGEFGFSGAFKEEAAAMAAASGAQLQPERQTEAQRLLFRAAEGGVAKRVNARL